MNPVIREREKIQMKDECLALFETAKGLVTYIDDEYVFDTLSSMGCGGIDTFLSDKFYDLIVDARKVIKEVGNGLEASSAEEKKIQTREECLRLFDIAKALATHVDKGHAFDKVNDMGSIGVETEKSEAFIQVIQKANNAIQEVERGLQASE